MIELGQLEKQHAEFERRGVRIAAISNDDQATAGLTQADFPHLIIVADADPDFSRADNHLRGMGKFILSDPNRKLARAAEVVNPLAPAGSDINPPTTILVDGAGNVRWLFRPDRFIVRLSPEHLLGAVDENLGAK